MSRCLARGVVALTVVFLSVAVIAKGQFEEHHEHHAPAVVARLSAEIPPAPDQTVITVDGRAVTTDEYLEYLRLVTEGQRLPRASSRQFVERAGLSLVLARQLPVPFDAWALGQVAPTEPGTKEHAKLVADWVVGQARSYAALLTYERDAITQGVNTDPMMVDLFEYAVAVAKAARVESLVEMAKVPATQEAIRSLVAAGPVPQAPVPQSVEPGPRWKKYLADLDTQKKVTRQYKDIDSLYERGKNKYGQTVNMDRPAQTPLAEVGAHTITLGEFFHLFGRISRDQTWNLTKVSAIEPLIDCWLAAAEFDALGLDEQEVRKRSRLGFRLARAATQIAARTGKQLAGRELSTDQLWATLTDETRPNEAIEALAADATSVLEGVDVQVDEKALRAAGWRLLVEPKQGH